MSKERKSKRHPGRVPGVGIFAGGRKRGSGNVKGCFEEKIPEVRCHTDLFVWVRAEAKAAGVTVPELIRRELRKLKERAEQREQREQDERDTLRKHINDVEAA